MQRNAMYRDKECQSFKRFEEHKQEELAHLHAELAAKEEEVTRFAPSEPPRKCIMPANTRHVPIVTACLQ